MKRYGLGLLLFIGFAIILSVGTFVLAIPVWEPITTGSYNATDPVSGSEWLPTRTYQFNITWNDSAGAVYNVTFESNITGNFINYTTNFTLVPNASYVINGTGSSYANYTINFTGVAPFEIIAYRWIAINASGCNPGCNGSTATVVNFTPTYVYRIGVPGKLSTNRSFYVPQSVVHLNWTNNATAGNVFATNFTIITNATLNFATSRVAVEILNSSDLVANYSQSNTITDCSTFNRKLIVTNVTGNGTQMNTFNSTNSSEIRLSLVAPEECLPGRYSANLFTIRNRTFAEDNVSLSLFVDIPISFKNDVNSQMRLTGNGRFSGSLPAYAPTYHSYYFNTTEVGNSTGVVVNVTWTNSSHDLDVFLFDASGNLKAKSINKTGTKEELVLTYANFTSGNAMWEVRIYSNVSASSAYTGTVVFSGLNATTNITQVNQSFNLVAPAPMNATNVTQVTFNITNEANLTANSMNETKVLYHVTRFGSNGTSNFTFLVPGSDIVNRIRVSVNWTGDTNYSFRLYKPANVTVHMQTFGDYKNANISGANQEEWNETDDIVRGFWRVEVRNTTNASVPMNSYNVSIFLYVNSSEWIKSNYTSFSWNRSTGFGVINNTNRTIQINFTVPNTTLNGTYEGYVKYESGTQGAIQIPILWRVNTGILVVNETVNSSAITIKENIGANITRTMDITFNNNGSYLLPLDFRNSSNLLLVLSSDNTKNVSFNYTVSNATFAQSGIFEVANFTFYINRTHSVDTQGIYEGFVFFNTSNNSHPYQGFNLSLRVNLTNELIARVVDAYSSPIGNQTIDPAVVNNITLRIIVTYQNGTEIAGTTFPELNATNFTFVYITEGNVTNASSRIPSIGTLSVTNGTSQVDMYASSGGYNAYSLNISIPKNIPGGLYKVRVANHYLRGGVNYTGAGDNGTLVVYDAGFEMTNYTNSYSISNTSTDRLYVNVTNWGPVSKQASLAFVESCAGYSVTAESASSGCNTATSGANFTDLDIAAHSSSCLLTFKITGASGASACSGTLTPSPSNLWFNNFTVSVTVSGDTGSGTTTTTTTGTSTTTSTTTAAGAAPKYLEIVSPATIFVVQGNSNSTKITVKNVNNTKTQNITLIVEDITQSWISSITPASADVVLAGTNANFTVTFAVPNTTEVKDYTGTFKASSSLGSAVSSFVLRVLPSEAKKIEINDTFALIKLNFTKLQTELAESKQRGTNVSSAEKLFDEAKALVQQAETHIQNGDYFSAFQLFEQIKAKIESAKAELSKAPGAGIFGALGFLLNPVYAIAIAAVVGGAVLLYLFWPTKLKYAPALQKPKTIEKPKVVEDVWEKLKEKWKDYYNKRKRLAPKQYYKYSKE